VLLFPAAAGLPSVKDNSYVMAFYLFVSDKQLDELFPLSVEVIMINADQVVAVYYNCRNGLIPSFTLMILKKVVLL